MIRERLWDGEVLRVRLGEGLAFDVWVERYANPPQVFYEGKPLPLDRLDEVVRGIEAYASEEGVALSWDSAAMRRATAAPE